MTDQLKAKPCPFCGEQPRFWPSYKTDHESLGCCNDKCIEPITDYEPMEDAIKIWNTRTPPKVKSLEWFETGVSLNSDHGGYQIYGRADGRWAFKLNDDWHILTALKDAKAAAQEHYNNLILSALDI